MFVPAGLTLEILQWVEGLLYQEDGCIAPEDVPLLMKVMGDEAGIALPESMTEHDEHCGCSDCEEED